MAKKKEVEIVVDEGIQLVSDELNKKLTNNLKNTPAKKEKEVEVDLGDVTVQVEEPKVAPIKMVKIFMNDNHKCCIGGEWYYLLKDKQYNVPENVKEVLLRANKLRPL